MRVGSSYYRSARNPFFSGGHCECKASTRPRFPGIFRCRHFTPQSPAFAGKKLNRCVARSGGRRRRFSQTSLSAAEHVPEALRRKWLHLACHGLDLQFPGLSAKSILSRPQESALCGGALLLLLCLILLPDFFMQACITISSLGFMVGALLRLTLARDCPVAETHLSGLAAAQLPEITVLVPLLHEARVLPDLIRALKCLEYPCGKLRILLLIEASDRETRRAAMPFVQKRRVDLLIIPEGAPRTKARACNYALRFVRSAYLVIFDAEDRPEPDQLLKAAAKFEARPDLACLQARLVVDNGSESLISGLFSVDYAIWFHLILPGFHRLKMPMPLGGSSNYFRTSILRRIGGWDAYNVTEDADLGIRLARQGYLTDMLNSRTFEEAPVHFSVWLRQRTRWMKGYMQTVFVHSRHPLSLLHDLRVPGTCCFILCILGCVLSALSNPVLWGIFFFGLCTNPPQHHLYDVWKLAVTAGGVSLAVNVSIALRILLSRKSPVALLQKAYIFFLPVYWTMMSVAAWRALLQLCVFPYVWEKTPHGSRRRMQHVTN